MVRINNLRATVHRHKAATDTTRSRARENGMPPASATSAPSRRSLIEASDTARLLKLGALNVAILESIPRRSPRCCGLFAVRGSQAEVGHDLIRFNTGDEDAVVQQQRAIDTRQQIVRRAAELFDREGFERATLSSIVDDSGLTKGSVYFHFKSKDELAAVVIEEQHAVSMNAVSCINRTNAPALEQIAMFSYEMAREIVEDPVVRAGIRLTLELSAVDGPPQPYLDWIDACERMFQAAIDEGNVLDTVDSADLARYFVSAFTGVQLVSNVLTARADIEARIDEMLAYVLAAIVPPRRRHKIDKIRQVRWQPASTD